MMKYKPAKKVMDGKIFKATYGKTKYLNVATHRAKGRRV